MATAWLRREGAPDPDLRSEWAFADIDDLARRVPELRKDEMANLAATGALNPLQAAHRRRALWKSTRAARGAGPLLAEVPENDPQARFIR